MKSIKIIPNIMAMNFAYKLFLVVAFCASSCFVYSQSNDGMDVQNCDVNRSELIEAMSTTGDMIYIDGEKYLMNISPLALLQRTENYEKIYAKYITAVEGVRPLHFWGGAGVDVSHGWWCSWELSNKKCYLTKIKYIPMSEGLKKYLQKVGFQPFTDDTLYSVMSRFVGAKKDSKNRLLLKDLTGVLYVKKVNRHKRPDDFSNLSATEKQQLKEWKAEPVYELRFKNGCLVSKKAIYILI